MTLWDEGGRAFLAERAACAKVQRQKRAWLRGGWGRSREDVAERQWGAIGVVSRGDLESETP